MNMVSQDDQMERLRVEIFVRAIREVVLIDELTLTPDQTRIVNRVAREFEERQRQALMHAALMAERIDDELERLGAAIGPTLETRRKLRADVVVRMFEKGHINRAQELAAEEIRDVREALARAIFPARRLDLSGTRAKGAWKGWTPLDALTGAQDRAWHRYIAWCGRMIDRPFNGISATRLAIVLAVIDVNIGWRQVERAIGVRHGAVLQVVAGALLDYAVAAGLATGRKKK